MTLATAPTSKAIVLGSIALLLPASQVILLGWPRPWAPFPVILVFPLFEGLPWPIVIAAPALAFLLTGSFVAARLRRPPLVSVVLATATALCHVWWLVKSWEYGVTWQGLFHTVFVGVVSVAGVAVGISLLYLAWRRSSQWLAFWGHWAMFAWLAGVSFPYLGELP